VGSETAEGTRGSVQRRAEALLGHLGPASELPVDGLIGGELPSSTAERARV
jgi:hypothetical protein